MKNWTSLLLINLGFLSMLAGQTEVALLQPGYSWEIYYWEQGSITPYTSGNRQFVDGDTIINGQTYQVIKARSLRSVSQPVFAPPFELEESVYLIGFMREDLPARKVYSRGINTGDTEYLTYDFNLEIGDTLVLDYLDQTKAVLDTITELMLPGGIMRRQFHFQNDNYLEDGNNTYIEGIGGSSSLFFPFDYNFEFGADLGCVRSGNESLYGSECLSVVKAEEPLTKSSVRVFPNPASDNIHIDLGEANECLIRILDTSGRVVLWQNFNGQDLTVSMAKIPSGLYFLELQTEYWQHQTKVIKR